MMAAIEYSEELLGIFMRGVSEEPHPARALRHEAEQLRLGNRKLFVRQLAAALRQATNLPYVTAEALDPEKIRLHMLEAARRIEAQK